MKSKASAIPSLPKRLSLVAQTVSSLCEGIENGHWQGHLPGERELCESLQVSRRTLRSALEELQRRGWLEVSARQKRLIKARRVKPAAEVRQKVVAILARGSFLSLPPGMSYIMDTLRRKLTAAGYVVQFHISPACYAVRPGRVLARFIADHPATIWLVLSAQEPMQRWFIREKISCLILGSCAPGIDLPSVDVDFHAACRHAGGVFLRKGHRRIALVLSKGIYGGDIASEEGLREALKDTPGAQLQVLRHDNTATSLAAALDQSLRSSLPPTAYLVGGATHAITVMMVLMRSGRRIPQDVAVISRDNDPILEAASPSVARYTIQPAQFASRIALVIRQLAETSTHPSHAVRLIPAFIAGDSV